MYSEQGLLALMGPSSGQVCQSLMVVLNWMPGSAQAQAALFTFSQRSRARSFLLVLPSMRRFRSQSPSTSMARMKASGTRTELLEFMPPTV